MTLLTPEIRLALPPLYSTNSIAPIVICKFFTPWAKWAWYVVEGQPSKEECKSEDFEFFGFVDGFGKELCSFLLSELETIKGPCGLKIERDPSVFKKPLIELMPLDFLRR
jgi:hypothetical protein